MNIKKAFWIINALKLYILTGVIILALIVGLASAVSITVVQTATYIGDYGLKHVIERIWYGPYKEIKKGD